VPLRLRAGAGEAGVPGVVTTRVTTDEERGLGEVGTASIDRDEGWRERGGGIKFKAKTLRSANRRAPTKNQNRVKCRLGVTC
jgi:hypothetical protein